MVVRLVHMRPKELDWNLSPFLKTSYFDEIHTISDRNAFYSERISAKEGLLVGSSSGAAFHASLLEAEKAAPGTNIVTIFQIAVSAI